MIYKKLFEAEDNNEIKINQVVDCIYEFFIELIKKRIEDIKQSIRENMTSEISYYTYDYVVKYFFNGENDPYSVPLDEVCQKLIFKNSKNNEDFKKVISRVKELNLTHNLIESEFKRELIFMIKNDDNESFLSLSLDEKNTLLKQYDVSIIKNIKFDEYYDDEIGFGFHILVNSLKKFIDIDWIDFFNINQDKIMNKLYNKFSTGEFKIPSNKIYNLPDFLLRDRERVGFNEVNIGNKKSFLCFDENEFMTQLFGMLKNNLGINDLSSSNEELLMKNLNIDMYDISFKPIFGKYEQEVKHSNPSEFMSKIIYIIKKQVLSKKNFIYRLVGASRETEFDDNDTIRTKLYLRLLKNFIKPQNIFKVYSNSLLFFKESTFKELNLINVNKSNLKNLNPKIIKTKLLPTDIKYSDLSIDSSLEEVKKFFMINCKGKVKEEEVLFNVYQGGDDSDTYFYFIQIDKNFDNGYLIFEVSFSKTSIKYSKLETTVKDKLDNKHLDAFKLFSKKLLSKLNIKKESYTKKYKRIF